MADHTKRVKCASAQCYLAAAFGRRLEPFYAFCCEESEPLQGMHWDIPCRFAATQRRLRGEKWTRSGWPLPSRCGENYRKALSAATSQVRSKMLGEFYEMIIMLSITLTVEVCNIQVSIYVSATRTFLEIAFRHFSSHTLAWISCYKEISTWFLCTKRKKLLLHGCSRLFSIFIFVNITFKYMRFLGHKFLLLRKSETLDLVNCITLLFQGLLTLRAIRYRLEPWKC